MVTLSPNKIAEAIIVVGGWAPRFTIGTGVPTSDDEKAAAIKFFDTAIAVCLAESGGNSLAKNSKSSASGLWQIMVSVHGDKIKDAEARWQAETGKELTIWNPLVNTDVARMVYQEAGNSWSPWETYTNGAYKKHRGHGAKAYAYLTGEKFSDKIKDSFEANMIETQNYQDIANLNPIGVAAGTDWGSLDAWVGPLTKWAQEQGIKVGVFVLALLMLAVGVWLLMGSSQTGRRIQSGAKKAAVTAAIL